MYVNNLHQEMKGLCSIYKGDSANDKRRIKKKKKEKKKKNSPNSFSSSEQKHRHRHHTS